MSGKKVRIKNKVAKEAGYKPIIPWAFVKFHLYKDNTGKLILVEKPNWLMFLTSMATLPINIVCFGIENFKWSSYWRDCTSRVMWRDEIGLGSKNYDKWNEIYCRALKK